MVLCSKCAQQGFVAFTQWRHMAQDQGRDFVSTSQFQLRQGFAGLHLTNQCPQRHEHATDMRRQNRTNLHVGDVTAFALMEANEHFAFFDHIAHRQAGAVAVAPSGALNGSQQRFWLDFAKMPKVVFKHPLFDGHLGRSFQVLHLAATTSPSVQSEIGATWPYALGRLVVNLGHRALLPIVFFAVHVDGHQLEWQSAFDEHHFAVGFAGDALGIHVQ